MQQCNSYTIEEDPNAAEHLLSLVAAAPPPAALVQKPWGAGPGETCCKRAPTGSSDCIQSIALQFMHAQGAVYTARCASVLSGVSGNRAAVSD
jgi:hypothetical protein